jgi:hypothetical protein
VALPASVRLISPLGWLTAEWDPALPSAPGRAERSPNTYAVKSKQLLDEVVVMFAVVDMAEALVGGVPRRSCELHLRQGTALVAAAPVASAGRQRLLERSGPGRRSACRREYRRIYGSPQSAWPTA